MATQESVLPKKIVKDLVFGASVKSTENIIEDDNFFSGVDCPCQRLANRLEKYVHGSLCFDTHQTLTLSTAQRDAFAPNHRLIASR